MTHGSASVGIIGKHPGYGDFLQTGLSEATVTRLTGWIDQSFAGLRDSLGNDWPGFWDQAQDLRFWVGPAISGKTLAGILHPSRDKVGRRYPFLLLIEGAAVPGPIQTQDQTLWEDLEHHMAQMQPGNGARALLEGLSLRNPPPSEAEGIGPTIWAHRHDGDLETLLASAGPVEQDRAQLGRSHWWAPGRPGRAATWLACPGLPLAPALGWLLAGVEGSQTPQRAPKAQAISEETLPANVLPEVSLSDLLGPRNGKSPPPDSLPSAPDSADLTPSERPGHA